jgi:hypothetical protein
VVKFSYKGLNFFSPGASGHADIYICAVTGMVDLFLYYIPSNNTGPVWNLRTVSLVGRLASLMLSHHETFYYSNFQCGTVYINNIYKVFMLLNGPRKIYKFDSPQLIESLP